MREDDVIAVGRVVVRELPVALELEPVRFAHDYARAWMPVQPFVDGLRDRPKILAQVGRVRVERAEDEAAIAFDARHLRKIVFGVLEIARVALGPGHAAELPGIEISPAV